MVQVDNPQGSQGFTGYTDTNGDCVNPAYLAQFFDQMGLSIEQAICSGRYEDRVFVLTQLEEHKGFLDTLVDRDGFAADLGDLRDLIENLKDQDGDGINDLQQLKSRLDALETSAQSQQTQIVALQTTQATQGQQLITLQDAVSNLNWEALGLDPNAIRCEFATDVFNAIDVGVSAFKDRLNVGCSLPTSLADIAGDSSSGGDAAESDSSSGGDAAAGDSSSGGDAAAGDSSSGGDAAEGDSSSEGEDVPDVL